MKIRIIFEHRPGDNINLSYELDPLDAEFVAELAHVLHQSMPAIRATLREHQEAA